MTKQQIKKLECYNNFSEVQKKVVLRNKNLQKINHELELIKNIGYDSWFSNFKGYYLNQFIVDEVIRTHK